MVSSKDLRQIFDGLRSEASKRASEAISDVEIGRRSGPPALLWLGIGLVAGAVIGMIAAILSSPYNGKQARAKLTEGVEKVRRQREDISETLGANGSSYATPAGSHAHG